MKKFICVLLTALLLSTVFYSAPFAASAVEESETTGATSGITGDCTWTIDDEGTLTISGNGVMEDYSGTINNDTYYTTSPWGRNIYNIVIENGVTKIGDWAFAGCKVSSVEIPDSVTSIGDGAFYDCYMNSVSVPDSVTNIGHLALGYFYGSRGSRQIQGFKIYGYPGGAESYANKNDFKFMLIKGSGVTGDCLWMLDESGKLTIIGEGEMGEYSKRMSADGYPGEESYYTTAPWGAGVKNVVIENGVTNIGKYSFYDCDELTSIDIPNSVTKIGVYAFTDCTGLTGVYIDDLEAWCKLKFYSNDNNPLYYAQNLYINNELVTDLIIPDTITSIDNYAFSGCTGITSVDIPNSVTSIGNDAFSGCTGITSVDIPDSLTSIGDYAFSGCTGITSVDIPDSVTRIGSFAFYGCTGITSVDIPNSVTSIGNDAFRDCTGLTGVYINDLAAWCKISFSRSDSNPLNYAHNLYINNELVTDLIIPNSVTSIGSYAFNGCTCLNEVFIPNSVTSIGSSAFKNCTQLTLIIDGNNTYALDYAQRNNIPYKYFTSGATGDCAWSYYDGNLIISGDGAMSDSPIVAPWGTDIKNAVIENGVTNIRSNAFFGCEKLTGATIPESVTSIGKRAFYGCKYLKSLVIPASVTSIGDQAFGSCADGFTIYGYSGSVAETYANENGITFIAIELEPETIIGDANGDKNLDVLDAAEIQKYASGEAELSPEQLAAADVNNDGNVDVLDAAEIQKFAAGIITGFKKKA